MQILLIGSGGREHALAWKLAQSGQVEKIFAAPGNPGIAAVKKCECVELNLNDLDSVADFAEEHGIDLTVVGPEATLVAGIADVFWLPVLPMFLLQEGLLCSALPKRRQNLKAARHLPKI